MKVKRFVTVALWPILAILFIALPGASAQNAGAMQVTTSNGTLQGDSTTSSRPGWIWLLRVTISGGAPAPPQPNKGTVAVLPQDNPQRPIVTGQHWNGSPPGAPNAAMQSNAAPDQPGKIRYPAEPATHLPLGASRQLSVGAAKTVSVNPAQTTVVGSSQTEATGGTTTAVGSAPTEVVGGTATVRAPQQTTAMNLVPNGPAGAGTSAVPRGDFQYDSIRGASTGKRSGMTASTTAYAATTALAAPANAPIVKVTVAKRVDASSAALRHAMASKTPLQGLVVEVYQPGSSVVIQRIQLQRVMVTTIQVSGDRTPMETVTFTGAQMGK
jgi:Type VI secretion system effector, Hcp